MTNTNTHLATFRSGGEHARIHAARPGGETTDARGGVRYTAMCGMRYTVALTGTPVFENIMRIEQCKSCATAVAKATPPVPVVDTATPKRLLAFTADELSTLRFALSQVSDRFGDAALAERLAVAHVALLNAEPETGA